MDYSLYIHVYVYNYIIPEIPPATKNLLYVQISMG